MKKVRTLLPILSLALLTACGGSNLPSATGEGTIRAINAIETSPDINFLIEEVAIGAVGYRSASPFAEYDDLSYVFNFEVFFTGDTSNTRFISRQLDVVADQDYTFLLSGTLANPAVTIWEDTEREFAADSTLFQARFAHAAADAGTVDYYFAAAGVAPLLGEQVATLGFGDIAPGLDFEAGDYVLTLTASGDPGTVLYASSAAPFTAQNDFIVTAFDGDASNNSAMVARAFTTAGAVLALPASSAPTTVEFLNASLDLGASDIYDDETLLSRLVENQAFGEFSTGIEVASGEQTFRYTPTGDTAVVTLEHTTTLGSGLRHRVAALGTSGSFSGVTLIPDVRPIETAAKLLILQTSQNFEFLSIYTVPPGESIDGVLPFRLGISSGLPNPASALAPGSYDVFITETGATDVLAGPVPLTVSRSDVVDIIVLDTADPAVLDLRINPIP